MIETKGVAFDLEGTIINLEPQHHQGHLMAAAEIGVRLTLDEALDRLPHFIGGPDEAVAFDLWEISDRRVDPGRILELSLGYFKEALDTTEIKPRAGFLEFLKEIRNLNVSSTIGTATARLVATPYVEKSGLRTFFPLEQIVFGEDVKNPKPAPDVYFETSRRLGILPTNQLVFEDSRRGVMAARNAGSIVIGMPVYDNPQINTFLRQAGVTGIFLHWNQVNIDSLKNLGIALS